MDKYEYRVKTEQMLEYLEQKNYKKAMDIADMIDWRRVKNASMLNTVSEIYEYNGEFQKSRDVLLIAFDRAPGSRKIVYRLGILALKIHDISEATDCYEEFVKIAPKDPNQYILKYKILRAQSAPLTEQIAALEDFKKAEYIEKWAYELAKLYHEAGMTAECLEECDDLILWFSEGKYVYLAMELKMKYKPLTPLQQEKYDSRPGAAKKKTMVMEETSADEEEADEGENEVPETTEEVTREEEPEEAEEEISEVAEAVPVNTEEVLREQEVWDRENMEEEPEEDDVPEEKTHSSITQIVKGATLEEALANGVALASGINIEEKAMKEREDELLMGGQMRIDDILQQWEEKQKENAEAIEKQKQKDEERIRREREEAKARQEEERREVERKAAEAARKAAEEEAARKAAEEAAKKAAEEEAARKAAEEAAKKAAEEEAARKAAEEEAARKAAEEAARKAAEEAA
ncbi:MAG: tetratricopeptide repeat protein, partial [Dorea sp.]